MTQLQHKSLGQWRREWLSQIRNAGILAPDSDIRDIICEGLGVSPTDIILMADAPVPEDQVRRLQDMVDRRVRGEPIDHIFGHRAFYGHRFEVRPDVLSPREDTEVLVEAVLTMFSDDRKLSVLDLGVGSGAIIATLLKARTTWTGVGVDISKAALALSEINAQGLGVSDRLTLTHSDWFENVRGRYDIIISNPPYINDEDMKNLSHEVLGFDPENALAGGVDGLDAYRAIVQSAHQHLKPEGYIVFEIGYDQGETVPELLLSNGYHQVEVRQDLSGHDRVVIAKRSN